MRPGRSAEAGSKEAGGKEARKRGRLPYGALISLFLLCVSAVATWGQSATPLWHGVLRNAGGAPIPGAIVRLAVGRVQAQAVTDSDGRFQLASPAGEYRLTVETGDRKIRYAGAIHVTAASPAVLLTLSGRGELTVAALEADQTTGGENFRAKPSASCR